MKYEMTCTINRAIQEIFEVEVTADSRDEALDLVHHVMEEWPDSDLVLDRVLKIGEHNLAEAQLVDVLMNGDAANDLEEPDDDGPEYA